MKTVFTRYLLGMLWVLLATGCDFILPDLQKPVITLQGEPSVTLAVGESYADAGATALDNIDGDITADIVVDNPVDTGKAGTYTITYNVSDAVGNQADEVTRTVVVKAAEDKIKPVITLLGSTEVNLTVGDAYDDAGATASDNKDGDITSKIQVTSDVNSSKEGNYTVIYTVSDEAGNAADTVTRHVMVKKKDVPLILQKRIFILGSSTVHAGDYISGDFNDPYGADRKLEGWGEQLKYYMKDPSKVYNRARSGADSITYRDPDPIRGDQAGFKDRDWGFTETLINETDDDNGGFLFIQFGANDSHHHIGTDVFQDQLEAYIADARRLGLTPVLLSPPNNRNHYNSRPYAEYVEPIATSKNVLFLDLHKKSMEVWADYEINEDYDGDGVEDNPLFQTLPEADILYGYLEYHGGINNTHFSPIGANIVAGWVKELACQSERDDAKLLCSQFLENRNTPNEVPPVIAVKGTASIDVNINAPYVEKGATASDDIDGDISANIVTTGSVDTDTPGTYTITYSISDSSGNKANTTRTVNVIDSNADTVTVHEDAEDGDTVGWALYGTTAGSTISNVEDSGSQVIALSGANGTANGFSFSGLNITSGFVVSWRLKYTDDFQFFVQIRSTNSPDSNIYMEYTPDDISTGLDGAYIRNGLGADANDGTWHTFTRDIEADFNMVYPDENITRIVGFAIRGSGRIDDISTSTRAPQETFTYNGHTYKIVKTALSWQDASDAAHADGGYLANIGSIAENHEIYSRLNRYIEDAEYAGTKASNGGEASYVWIGANDLTTEGTWVWENSGKQFWSGIRDGNSVNGLYSNWGRNTSEVQREPDNAGNQDAAAMAITEWQLGSGNLGQSSQWNDLKTADALYYIVEYANQEEIVLNELKAFPTAEGAGANASGGRGGQVIYVTNRDADGNGSLKWALTRDFNRTIVFAIGGRFDLNTGINLGSKTNNVGENTYNNFTLAGQTAWDKGGVHLANNGDTSTWARHFNVYGQENMILRYFDTRFNWQWYTKDNASDQQPSIRFVNSSDLIIDHMTSGWSAYGLIITNGFRNNYDKTIDNITVQRSLFHENIINPEATGQKNHNVGLLLGALGTAGSVEDWNKIGQFSIHKNAFIGVSHRFPNTAGGINARFDIINNYVYGFDGGGHKRLVRAGGNAHNDFRNNAYQETLYSPSFSTNNLIGFTYLKFIPDAFNPEEEAPNFYIDSNLFLSSNEQRLDITDTVQNSNGRDMLHLFDSPASMSDLPNLILRNTPNSSPDIAVSILNANDVKENILNNVGGNVKFANDGTAYVDNSIDSMYLDWAKNNNGPTIITENIGDGGMGDQARFVHPVYSTDVAVDLDIYDTDRDGIPNQWELDHHLDPDIANNNAVRADRNWDMGDYRVINNAGYTDLEMYLADIAGDFHMLAQAN